MGLNIKNFKQIMTGMVDYITTNTSKLTDWSVGSANRTLIEGIATEIEEAYFNMYKNYKWAIENAIFKSFGFDRLPAVASTGIVTLTFTTSLATDLFLPKGTLFSTLPSGSNKPTQFSTNIDYNIVAGSKSADLTVYCTQGGIIGNVTANSITIMNNPISVVLKVTNSLGFTSGVEAETLADRQARFNKYIQTLAKGTTKAIQYGCMEISGVAGAVVDDTRVALVNVYCHDRDGNLTADMQTAISKNLENYRAAGVDVKVLPIVKNTVVINITVTVLAAYNTTVYRDNIVTNLTNYINNFPVSTSLYLADIYQFVMNIDTIGIVNVRVNSPTADVIATRQQILRASTVTVTLTT